MAKPPHNQRGNNPQANPRANPAQSNTPQVTTVRQTQQWSGPLPHPDALDRFNQIIPNGADRIVKMVEQEQIHRIEYERLGLSAAVTEARIGQVLGAIICVTALGGAVYTAFIGAHWSVSIALVSVPLLGIIRAFMRPRA